MASLKAQFTLKVHLLLLSCLLLHHTSTHAQSLTDRVSSAKVAFSKFQERDGWKAYSPRSLTPEVLFGSGPPTLPSGFRSYIRNGGGFTYEQLLAPGTYNVNVGFIEQSTQPCRKTALRSFTISVNDKLIQNINIVEAVGCQLPYVVKYNNILVNSSAKLIVVTIPISSSNYPPVLSNFEATPVQISQSNLPTSFPVNIAFQTDIASNDWISFESSRTLPTVSLISTSTQLVPEAYQIYAQRTGGFTHKELVPAGRYRVTLGWAEVQDESCQAGNRVFSVQVNGISLQNIDVFSSVGCYSVYTRVLENVQVLSDNTLSIRLLPVSGSLPPFLSTLQISLGDLSTDQGQLPVPSQVVPITTPTASTSTVPITSAPPKDPTTLPVFVTPAPSNSVHETLDTVRINAGGPTDPNLPSTYIMETGKFVLGTTHGGSGVYRTARGGSEFTYSFDMKHGSYNISLGFIEFQDEYCNGLSERIFDVYVNDLIYLESFNILSEVECRRGIEKSFPAVVSRFNPKPIIITFKSATGNAAVSLIDIQPSSQKCIPESTGGSLSDDHGAHAIPGSYPARLSLKSPKSYVDADGDGFVTVLIDGSKSHTHFFDTENNVGGRITDFTWQIVETGEIISKQKSFRYPFRLGITRIRLTVTDNSCSEDKAETNVAVTGNLYNGIYCYFYQNSSVLLSGGTILNYPRPNYALVSKSSKVFFPKDAFAQFLYSTRCVFLLKVDKDIPEANLRIATYESGSARLYKGDDLIIDTRISASAITSLSSGFNKFEMTFARVSLSIAPKVRIQYDGNAVPSTSLFHDRNLVLPIVSSVSPREGQTSGGTTIEINGHGLYQPIHVWFGQTPGKIVSTGKSISQFFVVSPPSNSGGTVDITVRTGSGQTTNAGTYSYSNECDSVGFSLNSLLQPDKSHVDLSNLPTSVSIWQDGKIYIGSLSGRVHVLEYDRASLTTTSHCYSDVIQDTKFMKPDGTPSVRAILGLTFDPRDTEPKPYLSVSTLHPIVRQQISEDNKAWWRNGAIDRLKPGTNAADPKTCLVYDKRIVSNLPVSNHDHSVNTILFTQKGDLLIAQGGNTNAGLPSHKLGGLWDTELSGAVLEARLSKPNFDGHIRYNGKDHHFTAKKKSGHVGVYATGLRNMFGMTMTSSGNVYGIDQGINCAFGNIASSCNDFNYTMALSWNISGNVDWPGKLRPKAGGCQMSAKRPDKLVHISKGSFYGHPNFRRQSYECSWIDPYSDTTADGSSPPSRYKKSLAFLTSSVTGITEYRANHFCGRLRGELVMTSYKGGPVYRVKVDGSEKVSGPSVIAGPGWGGIAVAENEFGDLIIPRLNTRKVSVLRPRVSAKSGVYIVGLIPLRHGAQGGTTLTIGGGGFEDDVSVDVGGKPCTIINHSITRIQCKTPAHSGGLRDLTVTSNGESSTLENAVLYMFS